jgi:hypothetical protein
MKKRAFEKLLREAIILEAEEQGARLAGMPTESIPAEAQARFDAALKTERQTAAPETTPEIPVKQETRARRIGRRWLVGGLAVVTTAALIFVIGLMAVSGISKGTKAAEAQPADQQPPEWTAEAQPEQPEAPAEEPPETSAPAPGTAEQQPPEPGDDLPEVKTVVYPWQGYSCLFPETFEIQAIRDQKLSATEKALLKLDMDALQTVGLTDMDYYLVAESMLNGKDLLTWYLTADGWDDKPEDFDTAESVEIVPGIVSVHYYNRNYDSYICIAKLNTIGTNILFLSASSLTKDGTADFDSIVKQFVKINGDFAPSDNDILNGKYGISKVFSGDGYQITLTEQFSEQKSEKGFDGYYTSYFGAVMIKIEPFTLKAGLADKTLTEYIQDVIRNNSLDAQPEERDGLIFYRYRRSGMCGWNFAFKGDTAFYLVQFMCREADESELTDLFFAFAKSMKMIKSDNASNG